MRTTRPIICAAAILLFASLLAAQSARSIKTTYDKFEHVTTVSTDLLKVDDAIGRGQQKQDLRLQSSYTCSGDTSRCRPEAVKLMFVSQTISEHLHSRQVTLIADGERIRIEAKWTGEYEGTGPLTENISANVRVEDFRQIACAKDVEGKLGDTTFKLSEGNLTAMQQLTNEIQ